MGNLKNEAIEEQSEDVQTHELLAGEMNYLKLLNLALQFHTMGQRILSGFLYYVCTTRLGYKDGSNLAFEIDLNKDDSILTVRLLPQNPDEAAAALDTPPQS